MKGVARRLGRLETHFAPAGQPKLTLGLTVRSYGPPSDLTNASCCRTLCGNSITELVVLDGDGSEINSEQMESFIASFPIRHSQVNQ